MIDKIKAKLISLEVGAFESEEDKNKFDKIVKGLWQFDKGIIITSYYNNDTGDLMSFIVSSKKFHEIIKEDINNLQSNE